MSASDESISAMAAARGSQATVPRASFDDSLTQALADFGRTKDPSEGSLGNVKSIAIRILLHGLGQHEATEPFTLASVIALLRQPGVSYGMKWVFEIWPPASGGRASSEHQRRVGQWKYFLQFLQSVDRDNDWTIAAPQQVGH
jgi:hypothetical protein